MDPLVAEELGGCGWGWGVPVGWQCGGVEGFDAVVGDFDGDVDEEVLDGGVVVGVDEEFEGGAGEGFGEVDHAGADGVPAAAVEAGAVAAECFGREASFGDAEDLLHVRARSGEDAVFDAA